MLEKRCLSDICSALQIKDRSQVQYVSKEGSAYHLKPATLKQIRRTFNRPRKLALKKSKGKMHGDRLACDFAFHSMVSVCHSAAIPPR